MKKCIAVTNQKGGVGKSTTSNALGAGLISKGFKVLYIDLDAQGNLSYSMGADRKAFTSLEVLTNTVDIRDAIVNTGQGDIVPATPALASADTIITETGKEYRLREAIEPIKGLYDYIILDTPPALGTLTINALTACTDVIIPAQADVYSLQGIGQLYQTIKTVQKYCNRDIKIDGIVVTRYSSRAILTRDMTDLLEETASSFNTKIYKTKIRECIALKEAQASKQDIFSYNSKCNASIDYMELVNEILED